MEYERRDNRVTIRLDEAEARELEDIVSYMAHIVDHDEVILEMSDRRIDEWWHFLFEASRGESFDDVRRRIDAAVNPKTTPRRRGDD